MGLRQANQDNSISLHCCLVVLPSVQPHTIVCPANSDLLAVYAWTGDLGGKFWFGDPASGERWAGDINAVARPREYYDSMAAG